MWHVALHVSCAVLQCAVLCCAVMSGVIVDLLDDEYKDGRVVRVESAAGQTGVLRAVDLRLQQKPA